ncbi:MAG: DUF3465 domain-containing protein [Candidatus Krumholzibacteriia bacterium]
MRRPQGRLVVTAVVLLLAVLWQRWQAPDPAPDPATGEAVVLQAYAARRSDVEVTVSGTVVRSPPDDDEGSRHQRFVMELPGGHTLLVAHNIDLAERVPLRSGDAVAVRGEYEWTERGGTVHWTHHDPAGRRAGGWIEHAGQRYR